MSELPLGVFCGLRRLADDGGRFMLLDLTGAGTDTLVDLMLGLAPFTTGVVVEPTPGREVWRRCATPLFGRIEPAADDAAVAMAKRTGADAVRAPAACAPTSAAHEIARLGEDGAADLAIDVAGADPWVVTIRGDEAPLAATPGAAGYLLTPDFWRPALATTGDRAARRLAIADDLAPRVQRLNARVIDRPRAAWLDR